MNMSEKSWQKKDFQNWFKFFSTKKKKKSQFHLGAKEDKNQENLPNVFLWDRQQNNTVSWNTASSSILQLSSFLVTGRSRTDIPKILAQPPFPPFFTGPIQLTAHISLILGNTIFSLCSKHFAYLLLTTIFNEFCTGRLICHLILFSKQDLHRLFQQLFYIHFFPFLP